MATYYSVESINSLIDTYVSKGGECHELVPGCLGYGITMLIDRQGVGLKTFIIQEHYLNEWSSGNTVRGYNKTPKKYLDMLEKLENEEE